MNRLRICLIFLLVSATAGAQLTQIVGTAPQWTGLTVEVGLIQNPISAEKVVLDRDTVDAAGNFSLKFSLNEVGQVWLSVNRFTAPLFAEPDGFYTIDILPSKESVLIPTWRPGSFEYAFLDPDSTGINSNILAFDQTYFDFYTRNAHLIGTSAFRKEIRKFEDEQELTTTSFLSDYVSYSLAETKLMAGFPKNELYAYYLKDDTLELSNPSFYSFFNAFYANYFDRYDARFRGASIANRLADGLDYPALDSLFLQDAFLQRSDIRQWVILKSIKESIYLKTYSGENLVDILKAMQTRPETEAIGRAVGQVLANYEVSVAPDLSKLFPPIEALDLSEKPTLVVVAQTGKAEEWKRESALVEIFLEEYGDYFQVAELAIGKNHSGEKKWQVVEVNSPKGLMDNLDIYRLPWYGWLHKDGKLIKDIVKPSDGLEERLYSLRAKAIESQKIKVGQ